MIERLAQAIRSGMESSGIVSLAANGPKGEAALEQLFEVLAMDAIEAMREPTAAQEAVMRDLLEREDRPPTKRWHWIWHEMIEAALQKAPGA